MLENFKTDIIYYDTASDFELEFNLCGCCRMRLFNDKCNDKKSLLLSLSRAVSRSRVIIVTASLFGEFDIFKTVATAIGSQTETVDNNQYGITSDAEITVIKGSLPLVTEDGIFGGCIIESGPQSLIVLTDNQAVRKTLMKTLIHPYIKEIASGNDDSTTNTEIITEPEESQIDTHEAEENIVDTEENTLITHGEYHNDNQYDFPVDDTLITEQELPTADKDDDTDFSEESEPLLIDNVVYEPDLEDDFSFESEDYYSEERKEKTSAFNIWMLVISIILLLGLAVLCFCIFYVPTKAGMSPALYLKDVFDTMFK